MGEGRDDTSRRLPRKIDAADGTSMKDGCGVVKATILAELREPDDRRRHIARERSQDGLELTGSDRYREAGGILDLIGHAAEERFRTAKNRNPLHLARPDARPNQSVRARAPLNADAVSAGIATMKLHLESGAVADSGAAVCLSALVLEKLGSRSANVGTDVRVYGYLIAR